jgi:hypothetical protein
MLKYRYQKLRDCMVGSWCPSLGVTGPLLLDRRNGQPGALTNIDLATAWQVSGGGNRNGWALNFDGVNDYVRISHSADLNLSTQFTLSGWINPNSPTNSYGALVSKPTSFVGNPYNMYGIQAWAAVGTPPRMVMGNAGAEYTLQATTVLSGWRHVACTFNRGMCEIYVGGRRENSTTFGFSSVEQNTQPLGIGGVDRAGVADTSRAFIDAVSVYNAPLTPSDIATLARYRGIEHETYRTVTVRGADVGGSTTYDLGNVDSRSVSVSAADAVGVVAPLVNRDSRSSSVSSVDSLTVSAGLVNRDSRSVTVSGVDAVDVRASLGNLDSRSVTVSHASDVTLSGGAIDLGNVDSRSVTVSARDAMSVRAGLANVDSRSATLSDMVAVALRAGLGNLDSRSDSRSGVDGLTARVSLANRDSRSETRSGVDDLTLVGAAQEQSFFLTDYSTLEPA